MNLLYYALGGGHGHVLRGLAILRALGGGRLLGPAALAGWAEAQGVAYAAAPAEGIAGWIASQPTPDLLLVDVFPRGVLAELGPLLERAPAWLVSRWVRPVFYLRDEVRAVIESRYERILWAETPAPELAALAVPQTSIGPILVDTTPLAREEARRALGLTGTTTPLILGLGSGEEAFQQRVLRLLAKVAARIGAELRFVSDVLPAEGPIVALFPAARYFAGADVVVTAAGYHAFHETRAAGVPTVFMPQNRKIDDQFQRARGTIVASDPAGLERAVDTLLRGHRLPPLPPQEGARRAARLVQRRMQAGILGEEEIAAMA
jgi:UDP:flavonoid glycosyltransferase YjiC (YdhE family)